MVMVGWVDTEDVAEYWPEAEDLTEEVLTSYLSAAWEQCEAYLPPHVSPIPPPVPGSYVLAQIMQARALHRSNVAGGNDQIGGDGLTVTLFPMDWTVRNLLRPRRPGRVT